MTSHLHYEGVVPEGVMAVLTAQLMVAVQQ